MTARTMAVKFYGGPLSGRTDVVPGDTTRITVPAKSAAPWWTYVPVGKDGMVHLFVLQSRSRAIRAHFAKAARNGKQHPLVEAEYAKPHPYVAEHVNADGFRVRRETKHGKAARRRALKRAAA